MKTIIALFLTFGFLSSALAAPTANVQAASDFMSKILGNFRMASATKASLSRSGVYSGRCVMEFNGEWTLTASMLVLKYDSDGGPLGPLDGANSITIQKIDAAYNETRLDYFDNKIRAQKALDENVEPTVSDIFKLKGRSLVKANTEDPSYFDHVSSDTSAAVRFDENNIYYSEVTEVSNHYNYSQQISTACYYFKKLK